MKTTKVTVGTRLYESSHGKLPKGKGNWAFINPDGSIGWISGTYTEARRVAVKLAKSQGFSSIEVGA